MAAFTIINSVSPGSGAPRPPPPRWPYLPPTHVPYTIEVDPDRRLSIIRLTGYVDADEVNRAADAQTQHPDYRADFHSMWDIRGTRAVDVSPEGLSSLVARKLERDAQYGLSGRIAIVVNRHTIVGAALLVKLKSSRKDARVVDVFPTEKQALAWLHS